MKLSDKVRVPDDVISREVGEGTVMLDLAKGAYFGLDPVGGRMWQLLGEGRTLTGVCDAIVEEFDVTREVVERDLLALVDQLRAEGLLQADD